MLQLLETGKALYVLTAICVLGVMCRLIARNLYKRLTKETDNMTLTKNRYLRDLKQKAENAYRLNQGLKNTKAYLEKQLYGYRFMGVTLNGWGNLANQFTILCFLAGGIAAFASYWYRCDNYYIVLYASVGILTGLLTMIVDYGVDLTEKKQQLLTSLQDYIENSLFNRLAREIAPVESIAEEEPRETARSGARENIRAINRVERMSKAASVNPVERTGKSSSLRSKEQIGNSSALRSEERLTDELETVGQAANLKKSLEQIAASRERSRTETDWMKGLSQEELQVVSDILREYLI